MNQNTTRTASIERFIPAVAWIRAYRREWFVRDLFAGLSVCLVMIPSVIAYAQLMGLPPERGLYAALVPLIIYALFGSSRQVIVGPDIAISLLTASAIAAVAAGDSAHAANLAALTALLTGVLLLVGAPFKIGAVADFLSKPVLIGYMSGAALVLMCSQLDKLLGVSIRSRDFFPRVVELAGQLPDAHTPTLSLGVGLLIVAIVLRRLSRKIPAALIVCLLAVAVSFALGLEQKGVAVVGIVRGGLPLLALPHVSWDDFNRMLPAAFGIALLTYTEGILLARAFATKNGYEISANQELLALGVSDVAAGLFQGFVVTGSQARTTLNDNSGGKTQVASLVAAAALALFIVFFTGLMAHLPAVALAAILIYAATTLIEFQDLKRIYRYYPRSAALSALTTLGVLAVGVVPGILAGVALSLLGLLKSISHPHDAILSHVAGHGFHDMGKTEGAQTIPGLIAYRFYAPLLFCNAGHFVARVREIISASKKSPKWFLLDAQAITDIDVTAAEALHGLNQELRQKGIELKIAHANPPLRAILQRIGFADELTPDSFFDSVHHCVDTFRKTAG